MSAWNQGSCNRLGQTSVAPSGGRAPGQCALHRLAAIRCQLLQPGGAHSQSLFPYYRTQNTHDTGNAMELTRVTTLTIIATQPTARSVQHDGSTLKAGRLMRMLQCWIACQPVPVSESRICGQPGNKGTAGHTCGLAVPVGCTTQRSCQGACTSNNTLTKTCAQTGS